MGAIISAARRACKLLFELVAGEVAYALGGARGVVLCVREMAILFFSKNEARF